MPAHVAIEFLKTLFGPSTTEAVYVCSLPNNKGDPSQAGERSIMGRDPDSITAFINRWDVDGRGCYFCTSTIRNKRNKANCVETPSLPLDIDFKSIMEDEATALRALQQARCRPSAIIRSGHGLHAHWFFKEALPTQDHVERLEAAMHQLADTFAGDPQVAHVASLMRLPGTHNTKGGQWWEVEIVELNECRYEL